MDSDQQQQKGLFTFYREQADLEEYLHSKKSFIKVAKSEKLEETQKKHSHHAPKIKHWQGTHKKNAHSVGFKSEHSQLTDKTMKDHTQKPSDSKDKLISILRKYNAKQIKRRDHLRVIMEIQEQPSLDQTEQLKNRLERLLADEAGDYFNSIQPQKTYNQQSYQQSFTKKKEELQRINPFKKLAIIPTSFTAELEEQKNMQLPLKKVPSPPKSHAYSLQVRKNDKVEMNMQQRSRYDEKEIQGVCQPLKLNLPKINARSSSQMMNKPKIRPSKLGEASYFDPVRSERWRSKPQLSIYLDSIRFAQEPAHTKHTQNRIYSLFIENKEQKINQQANSVSKEIRLADVVRRMKFS